MASQVLIKIPVPFTHGRRGSGGSDNSQSNLKGTCKSPLGNQDSSPESPVMTFNHPPHMPQPSHGILSVDASQRVIQLEQNMRFLQEQHHQMLSSLHQEIESLRLKNRELQFQLIINNGANNAPISLLQSFPPSPEDDSKPKVVIPPKQVNVKPLRVEILERETGELRAALEEAQKQRSELTAKDLDYKRRIKELEAALELLGKENLACSSKEFDLKVKENYKVDFGCQTEIAMEYPQQSLPVGSYQPDSDLLTMKLEEAERMVRHLRRENEDQKRELGGLRMQLNKGMGRQCGGRGGRGDSMVSGMGIVRLPPNDPGAQIVGLVGCVGDGGLNGVNARGNHAINHRFPPLQSQSYWHHSHQPHVNQRVNTAGGGMDFVPHQSSCNGGHLDKNTEVVGRAVPQSLPSLGNANPAHHHHNQQHHVFRPLQNTNRHSHFHINNGGLHPGMAQHGNGHYRREQKGGGRGGEDHNGGDRKYRLRGRDRDGSKQ
ncbi:uncharacterized protein LOC124163356 [Ischnura elegans]|uniref:uncharacterized protein LOC124163356 n=1 Tax=Ischnura elegans TaxID=197161 RepID=UPI001ED8A78E|nr:uncharacterized protein LOC124163356 [Ischnura elegans]XP_046396177.1 uncharacterized protein LOC124163356 [Ischnura elegans]XP_046396186.1 uncharacterized protein LOC124163356 [Ischnura elegans]